MIDTNKILNVVKDTPLKKMDDNKVIIDKSQAFGFISWQGIQNGGRWYGYIVYQNTDWLDRVTITGQGTSDKGYTTKENALKYAMVDFEKNLKHIYF